MLKDLDAIDIGVRTQHQGRVADNVPPHQQVTCTHLAWLKVPIL